MHWIDLGTARACAVIVAPQPGLQARFGSSVAASDSRIIVGEDHHFPVGAAHVYTIDGQCLLSFAYTLIPQAETIGGVISRGFGCSMSLLGESRIVIGARGPDLIHNANTDPGSAYVFDVITGQQIARLTPVSSYRCFWFGASVAVAGHTILVGAPRARSPCSIDQKAGAAMTFDASRSFTQTSKLVPTDVAKGDEFGSQVAAYSSADGEAVLFLAAPYASSDLGAVYRVTQRKIGEASGVITTWSSRIDGPDPLRGPRSRFGSALALDSNLGLLLVGAPLLSGARGLRSGGAALLRIEPWAVLSSNIAPSNASLLFESLLNRYLWGPDSEDGDLFGSSVMLASGAISIVGAAGHRHILGQVTGGAYVFHPYSPPSSPPLYATRPAYPYAQPPQSPPINGIHLLTVTLSSGAALLAVLFATFLGFALKFTFRASTIHQRSLFFKKKLVIGARRTARDIARGKWPKPKGKRALAETKKRHIRGGPRRTVVVEELVQRHCRIAFNGDSAPQNVKAMQIDEIMAGKPPMNLTLATSEAASARMAAARDTCIKRQVMPQGNPSACRIVRPARVLPHVEPFSQHVVRARTFMSAEQALGPRVATSPTPLSPRLQSLLKLHTPDGTAAGSCRDG